MWTISVFLEIVSFLPSRTSSKPYQHGSIWEYSEELVDPSEASTYFPQLNANGTYVEL
jgi:hypothetical protein